MCGAVGRGQVVVRDRASAAQWGAFQWSAMAAA